MKLINISIFLLIQEIKGYFLSGVRDLKNIPFHSIKNTEYGNFETRSLGDLYKGIEEHSIRKIYFSDNLKEIYIKENENDNQYNMKVINSDPILTDKIIELSSKSDIDTMIMTPPHNIFNDGLKFAGNTLDFIIISLFISTFIQFVVGYFTRGNRQMPMNPMNLPFLNKDKRIDKTILNISLSDWAGSPEVFEECTEIVSYIKNSTLYKNAGADIPKGILLEGPPGTGKTLIAKAIAKETNATFLSVPASEFVELFVGMGAAKIRDLFSQARQAVEKENNAAIIFIDEIDAVGRQRGSSNIMGGNDEREQTLNQLLSEMDGFQPNTNIIVIAATNRKDILDSALLRPGRFDRIIYVPLPDKKSREDILKLYMKSKKIEDNISLDFLAEMTSGFSGAQIKNLLNEAAINTARNGSIIITQKNIEDALEKIVIGITKKIDTRTEDSRYRIALHEMGHAILAANYKEDFELIKVSMKSTYSGIGGYTLFNDNSSKKNDNMYTKDLLKKRLAISLAGKAAEYIYYGEEFVSLGAFEDLKQANQLAKQMITNYGMGDSLEIFFDNNMNEFTRNSFSEKTKELIDKESINLLFNAYEEAKIVIQKNKDKIDELVKLLLRENILSGEEVYSKLYDDCKIQHY
jgi:cell division protease FtsH